MADGQVVYDVVFKEDGASLEKLNAQAKKTDKGMSDLASKIGAVGGATALLVPILNGGKDLFNYAAGVEQMQIAWESIAKQDAPAMMEKINKVASKTPYEIAEIDKSYKSLYNSGIKIGDIDKVFTVLGDTASGVGAPVDQVTRAFSQMQSKGKVTGEEMLQLSEAGVPAWKLLADSMGLSVAQVQVLSAKGKLGADSLQLLLGGMEKSFGGGMQKQAGSFNGLMSTLSDTIRSVVTPAFLKMQEVIKPVLQFIIDALNNMNPVFVYVGIGIVALAGAFAGLVGAVGALGLIMPAVTSAISILSAVFGALSLPVVAIGIAIAGLVALIVMNWDLIVAKTMELWNVMAPVFMNLKAQFDAITPSVMNMVNNVIKFLTDMWVLAQPIIEFFKQMLADAFNFLLVNLPPMMQAVGDAFFAMVNFIITAVNFLLPIIKAMADFFMAYVWPVVKTALEGIRDTITVIFNVLVDLFNSFWTIVTGIFKTFTALLKGDWQGVWDGIKQICDGALRWLTALISGALSIIMSVFVAIFNNIKAFVSSVFSGISSVVSSAMSAISSNISGFMNSIKEFFVKGFNSAKDAVQSALDGVRGLIGGFFNIGKDIVSGIVNGLSSSGDSIKNFLLDMAKGALDAVKNFFGIHSPSRVFRDEVGVMIGKGLSIGIDKSSKEVDKSAKSLAESALNNAKIDSLVGKSSLSDSIASRLSATVPLTTRNSSIGALNLTVNSNSADAGQVFTEMQSQLFNKIDEYLGGQYAY